MSVSERAANIDGSAEAGKVLLAIAAICVTAGSLIIKRIVDIKV